MLKWRLKVNHSHINIWRIATVFLTAVTVVVFLPSLENGFVGWDDNTYIFENREFLAKDFYLWNWLLTAAFYRDWHPLTMFTFGVDYTLWGLNPYGYHLSNLFFHTLNVLLLFFLASRLMQHGLSSRNDQKRSLLAAFVAALLWGIHPLRVESVAWISGRKELLCTFFFLLSICTYLRYVSTDGAKRRILFSLSLVFFVASFLSKPVSVTMPIVLLILDYFPLNRITRLSDAKMVLLEKLPFFLLGAFSGLKTLVAYYSAGTLLTLTEVPLTDRILIAANSYLFYLHKTVFSINLVPYYPFSRTIDIFDYRDLYPMAMILLVTTLSILLIRKVKAFSVVWFFYIVMLLPVSGAIQSGVPVAADRYTYIPSIGLFVLVGVVVGTAVDRFRKNEFRLLIGLSLVIFLGAQMVKTVRQIPVWHDTISLWSHQIDIYPNTAEVAYNNRGNEYNRLGNYKQAIIDLDRSIEVNPYYYQAYNNRGNSYFNLGYYDSSVYDYGRSIEINPKFAEAYYNRGNAYLKLDRFTEAMDDFNNTIRLDHSYALAYNNRGIVYDKVGDYEKAIRDFNKAIELDPGCAGAYFNLATEYLLLGNKGLAEINFKKAGELGLK